METSVVAAKGAIKELLSAFQETQGYPIVSWGRETIAAKKAISLGYTKEQVVDCLKEMQGEPFWKDKHIPLICVVNNLGPYLRKRVHSVQDSSAFNNYLNQFEGVKHGTPDAP